MTKHTKHHPDAPEAADTAGDGGEATAERASPANDNPAELVAQLEAEKSELKDKLLRTLAEVENIRRRTEREVADARSYAISKFAGDMLGVADNMGRALAALPAEARDSADATVKALLDGAELTEREMLRALEKHGVKRLDPEGREVRSEFPPGDLRGAGPGRSGRNRRAGRAGRLLDR